MTALRNALLATTAALGLAAAAEAQDYGKHDGYTLRVKLIGGAQYEPLYTLIPQWEEATGAKVEILSRKSHFELDREMKQDIASGNIDYCVFSSHTNFAPQYAVMNQSRPVGRSRWAAGSALGRRANEHIIQAVFASAQYHQTPQHVLQLADIAGPVVSYKFVNGFLTWL